MHLILLPGLLCNADLWRAQIARFSGEVDVDVPDLSLDDTISAMAARVLKSAPDRFALAGLSMGGYVAFEILRQAPERVERLALLDTSARADTPETLARRKSLISLAETGRFKGVTSRLMPSFVHPDRLNDAELTKVVIGMAEKTGRDGYMRQQTAIIGRQDSRRTLTQIRAPTLVVCGADDQVTPLELSREMATDIPNSRLVVLERCGHLAPLERPDEVNSAFARWLAD
jgi:pimeloyl-ACP methyl ester carboxylesterase